MKTPIIWRACVSEFLRQPVAGEKSSGQPAPGQPLPVRDFCGSRAGIGLPENRSRRHGVDRTRIGAGFCARQNRWREFPNRLCRRPRILPRRTLLAIGYPIPLAWNSARARGRMVRAKRLSRVVSGVLGLADLSSNNEPCPKNWGGSREEKT